MKVSKEEKIDWMSHAEKNTIILIIFLHDIIVLKDINKPHLAAKYLNL